MKYKRIDKYEFIGKIGQGGMSNIYKVRDVRLKKYWAVKEIDLGESDFENGMKQNILEKSLLGEMEILKNLEHPALPGIVDYFKIEKKMYIVIDYIEGENLKEKVEREGRQKEEEVLEWALQICDALEYLHHKKIIYRDLKPSNIMLNKENRVKLIDFGTARFYKKSMDEDTIYLGTKVYAAPEQFGGMGQTDARTDIYSLGMTLSYLLCGKSSRQTECKEYTQKHLGQFYKIIEKCIMLNPNERYQSCKELKVELLKYKEYREKIHREGKQRKRQRKRQRRMQKKKRIFIYSFFVFGIVGGFCYIEKNGNDEMTSIIKKTSEMTNLSEQEELSKRTGISNLSELSKIIQTSEPVKTSEIIQTSKPTEVGTKVIQTSEPTEAASKTIQISNPTEAASKAIQTSEPKETSEVIKTVPPTEIPETVKSSQSSQTAKSKGSVNSTTRPIKTSKPNQQSEIEKNTDQTRDSDKISKKPLTTTQPKKKKSKEKSNTKNEELIIEIIE